MTKRLNAAADVLSEIMSAPDKGTPQDLLDKAACAMIVPGVKKGAFIVGANTAGASSSAEGRVGATGRHLGE
jgi:lipid-binding SYLF domain-containing protein